MANHEQKLKYYFHSWKPREMRVRVMPKAQYLLGTPRWWRLASPRAFGGYLNDYRPHSGPFDDFAHRATEFASLAVAEAFSLQDLPPQGPLSPSFHSALQNSQHPSVNDNVALSIPEPAAQEPNWAAENQHEVFQPPLSLHASCLFSSFVSMYSIRLVVCRPGVVPFGLLPFFFSFIHLLEEPRVTLSRLPLVMLFYVPCFGI